MSSNEFNLPGLYLSIMKHKRVILIITLLSAITGAIFYYIYPKKYEAKTEFILKNPIYGDKNNIYNTKQLDYFASEDDVNRAIFISQSELVQMQVIRNMNLAAAYGIDTNNPKALFNLKKIVYKNMNIIRTEYQDLILTYLDADPVRASNVANEFVRVLEKEFNGFYYDMRTQMLMAVKHKVAEEDSTIKKLTDSLVHMRDQYQIYDIISPARHNIMVSSNSGSKAGKNMGRGLEEIQNVEAIKDEIVSDMAVKTTLMNDMTTGLEDEHQFPMIKTITSASVPVAPKGLGGILTVLTAGALGFFFCTIIMMIVDNFKAAIAHK